MASRTRSGAKAKAAALVEEDEDGNAPKEWLEGVEATWDNVQEDEGGKLHVGDALKSQRRKRRRMQSTVGRVKRGMMRNVLVCIDMSENMSDKDLRPTRLDVVLAAVRVFVDDFFSQNPISHLGLMILRRGTAEVITGLSGSKSRHLQALDKMETNSEDYFAKGDASLQNGMKQATKLLSVMPSHATRELLILYGSLTTCDPGDVFATMDVAKQNSVRVSVIGLAAAIRVCETICKTTGGSYSVISDADHLAELLKQQTVPPIRAAEEKAALMKMGFPVYQRGDRPTACMGHASVNQLQAPTRKQKASTFHPEGYYCPQCSSKYCDLPVECRTCGLLLVASPHLARSYHHLFPLPAFREAAREMAASEECTGCGSNLTTEEDSSVYQCPTCELCFCLECDIFCHESLHGCPGCSNRLPAAAEE